MNAYVIKSEIISLKNGNKPNLKAGNRNSKDMGRN
jgi:hypothetical protein